jgi:DNA-binding beta-propeller fold protein YncE
MVMQCHSRWDLILLDGFLPRKTNAGAGGKSAGRPSVGEIVGTKFRTMRNSLAAGVAVIGLLLSGGCGSGGGAANVITIRIISSSGTSLILGQSTTLTAIVTGATNTNVNWTPVCQFTTTTTDSTGKVTTSKPATCPPDTSITPQDPNHTIFGVFSNQQATGTEVFTAPSTLPDQTKYPGLQIIATAQSVQNTSKTGMINLTISSGIRVTFSPGTATIPTKEQQRFTALLTNDLGNKGVTWSITQQVPNSTAGSTPNPYTPLATCSPTCGTLNVPNPNDPNTVVYTAPDTVPTAITPAQKNNTNSPANVTIVAVSNADKSCSLCFVIGTITIIPGGPITFNGISPAIAPQGATLWDIYLDAPNISSASTINLTYGSSTTPVLKDSASGQIKVLFPVPASSSSSTSSSTCSTTNPCSTGARLRLLAPDLVPQPSCPTAQPCPVTVSVIDPAQPCNSSPAGTACTATGTTTFNIMPVRATSTATVPDDIIQGGQTQNFPVTIDGGYFGPYGPNLPSPNNLTRVFFQSSGNTLNVNQTSSNSRQLITSLPAPNINPTNPGLYPLYVVSTATPAPSPNNPSVTNMALFPDYSVTQPAVSSGASGIPAGMNPSAVDIDPDLGVLVVAETGSNTIEFFSIGNGVLASICTVGNTVSTTTCPGLTPPPINVPTGVSVNRTNHTVAVVNYGSQTTTTTNNLCQITALTGQSVTVLNIPGNPSPITPFSVDLPFNTSLGPALQGSVCPAPMPYSIGVDPDSNLALVAYSATSSSSVNNLGFIVNLNPNSGTNNYGCALTDAITGQSPSSGPVGHCLFAQVTLNVGTYPQVAMAPHGHLGLVTPGGSGTVRGVDVTKPSTANLISSATLTAGLVTVTVDTTQCPPGVSATSSSSTNPCPLLMVPGNAGSVLITGLTAGNAENSAFFNGVFTVNVTSNNSFTYVVNTTATDACKPPNSTTTSCGGEVFYGSPDQIFGLPATTQGIAINPFTSTAALADANATGTNGPQINLLSGLDQSVSSIFFLANCTAFTTSCLSGPEFTPTADVAWQPYTNTLVSYNPNPHVNQVSISDPVTRRRYAFACVSSASCQANPIVPSQVTLNGTGMATLIVQNGTGTTANPATLQLFGGLAVDPATNQAFVVKSGSSTIDIIDLNGSTPIKSTHISEVIVPSTSGVPKAVVPQAALTCTTPVPPATTCDLPGVKIFGSGFTSGMQVRLDGIALPASDVAPPLNGGREVDVTIPASIPTADPNNPFKPLSAPHKFALDVLSNGAQSNAVDFIVVQSVNLSTVCTDSSGNPTNTQPSSVAIADQIADVFSPIALVSVTGCNDIVVIDLNPTVAGQPNPNFGKLIGSPVSVGTSPQGIAIWQRKGLAVVANNGSNTVSVLDLTPLPKPPVKAVPDITNSNGIGTNPTGVAINDATGAAIVTNTASNTISMINLGLLFPPSGTTPPTTLTATSIGGIQEPTAVAIDPDRGTNNQGIAVVTALQLSNGAAPTGALAVVEIGLATPALSTTISSGFVSSTPTGIVFDPAVATNTTNPGVFFANSSGTNSITEFNPDSGGGSSVSVGINPTSLAINPQTGAMLTSNSASNTISVVDTISSPFKTRQTLGFPGSPTFGVAIDQFTNLAVIVDQANNRVLLFPMPN